MKNGYLAVLAFLSMASVTAHAALPAGVETAITGAGTDVTSVGGSILLVMVGIAVIAWIRKVMH